MKNFLPALVFICFLPAEKISAQLSATITPTNPTCVNNNGSATVTASGGSGYTYVWSNGGTIASVNNLSAGTYTVTVFSVEERNGTRFISKLLMERKLGR